MSLMDSSNGIPFILACIFYFVSAAKLDLFDYSQDDSNTTCKSGLLLDVDQSGFKSVVHLDNNVGKNDYLKFEFKEQSAQTFDQLLTIGLLNECVERRVMRNMEFSCKKISDKEFHVRVLLKALRQYSNAIVRGFLDTADPTINRVQLPAIYEPADATGELTINGKVKSADLVCQETIDKEELNLEFNCSGLAQPCVAEMYLDDVKVGESKENGFHYSQILKKAEEVQVTIKFAACRLDGIYNTVGCKINSSYIASSKDKDSGLTLVWILVGVVTGVTPLILIVYYMCKHKREMLAKTKANDATIETNLEGPPQTDNKKENAIPHEDSIPLINELNIQIKEHKNGSFTHEEVSRMFKAAETGDLRTILFYAKNESINNVANEDGVTLLMKVSEYGYIDIVKLLIENGADVKKMSLKGDSAIGFATRNSHSEIVELLKKCK